MDFSTDGKPDFVVGPKPWTAKSLAPKPLKPNHHSPNLLTRSPTLQVFRETNGHGFKIYRQRRWVCRKSESSPCTIEPAPKPSQGCTFRACSGNKIISGSGFSYPKLLPAAIFQLEDRVIVPLKWIEYGVYRDLFKLYPKHPKAMFYLLKGDEQPPTTLGRSSLLL